MLKKINLLSLLLGFTLLSCYDMIKDCDYCPDYSIPSLTRFNFSKFTIGYAYEETFSFYSFPINEYNIYDTTVLSCHIAYADIPYFDEIPIERIPTLVAKVTTLNSGDTEYYPMTWYEQYKGVVLPLFPAECPPPHTHGIPVILLKTSTLPIVYEPSPACLNDGLLTVSPEGDQLFAEITFLNKRYTDTLYVKPD